MYRVACHMAQRTTVRNKDTHLSADRLAKQMFSEILHLVPEVLQLLCQYHFGLREHLTLFVVHMLFHREA